MVQVLWTHGRRSHWHPCLFDVVKLMILPQAMACSNERLPSEWSSLTGVNRKAMYQSQWYYHRERFNPVRDRHCKRTISLVLMKIDATSVDGMVTEETRFQRENDRVDGTTAENDSSHSETDIAKTVSQWQHSLRNGPKSTILPRRINLFGEGPTLPDNPLTGLNPVRLHQSRRYHHI
jgi:hypothetical protein